MKAVLDASASEHMSPGSLRPSVLTMPLNQITQRMCRDLVFFALGMWVPAGAQTSPLKQEMAQRILEVMSENPDFFPGRPLHYLEMEHVSMMP